MNVRTAAVVIGVAILFCTAACKQKDASRHGQQNIRDTVPVRDYLSLIISLDTLSSADYKQAIYREDSLLTLMADTSNPFYHFFRGKRHSQQKHGDSAVTEYRQMKGAGEVELLKNYSILEQRMRGGMTVEGELMSGILATTKNAERLRSKITYKLYDLMAQAYYQNDNANESLEYTERYYKDHPFKLHPVVMQRHFDISFLLSSRMNDFDKMMLYNVEARNFARKTGDSMAIARTYDNEAQIFSRQGQHEKALASSKIYFNYLVRTNNLNDVAYNNLATSFLHNHELDSAIHYYRVGISSIQKKYTSGKQSPIFYKGLIEALKTKGAYAEALTIADSAYQIEIDNIKRIQAVKFAEIHERYETEKKDRNIAALSSRNELNEKVIRQQRWTLILAVMIFLGALFFLYFMHRQYRLKEKNRLLQSENKRLNMEQKLLQAQLNPHFIFNSIANLQSLVASGDTKESVRYLSAFSGLLRNILEQSRKDFIGLDEEIITLEHYLQLNRMRFAGLFDYAISVDKQLYPESILIPPMLIQPFVENAIEHGFRNIDYKGILTIFFKVEHGQMFITVEDNGKGLMAKEPNEQKKQSLAGIILKERLEVLFKSQGQEAKYEIIDKKDTNGQGVIIHIVIPEIKD